MLVMCCSVCGYMHANCLVKLLLAVCLLGGEASGSGQAGDTQHSQEADCLPAGSAGD